MVRPRSVQANIEGEESGQAELAINRRDSSGRRKRKPDERGTPGFQSLLKLNVMGGQSVK